MARDEFIASNSLGGEYFCRVGDVKVENNRVIATTRLPEELMPNLDRSSSWNYHILLRVNDGQSAGAPDKLLVLEEQEISGNNKEVGAQPISVEPTNSTSTVESTPAIDIQEKAKLLELRDKLIVISIATIIVLAILTLKLIKRI